VSLRTPEKIQRLRESLYDKAKREPDCRFHFLYDKIYREDVLIHAYALCRQNGGAPGVDGQTFEAIESGGVERWLAELQEELHEKRYRAQPVRRVMIPKASGLGERPLGIPTIRDRVIQTAAKLVLEPIFEADFDDAAYGYRPGRSAIDAVESVHNALRQGRTQIVDADLSQYFDTIPHAELMKCLMRRISDGRVLQLIKMWLKVPVEERDDRGNRRMSGGKKSKRGTPQGGVISPLLANVYMNRFIKAFRKHRLAEKYGAELVCYADDFVVLCKHGARDVLAIIRRWMERIGLALNEKKTSVKNVWVEPFDFLGYRFGVMYSPRTGQKYLGAAPSPKAIERLRAGIRGKLRPGNQGAWPAVVQGLNRTLRGWTQYFCYGTVHRIRQKLDRYVHERVRAFLRRRHKRTCRLDWNVHHGELGVVSLHLVKPRMSCRETCPRAG
jgi:RNA-directed DNA polymerase